MRSIHMGGGMLTFNPEAICKIFRVGDVIQFYPQIKIEYYTSALQEESCIQHIVYDIYKLRFRPIDRFFNNQKRNCYHYLIEIFPGFNLFCFNWKKPYKSYLNVGQWYDGYVYLNNCGNASKENEYIPSLVMDNILRTGKLTGIYENLLWRDFRNDEAPYKAKRFRYAKDVYCYEDVLDGYGYSQNLEEFSANISRYKEKSIIYNSTEELPEGSKIIFCVDILNSQTAHK